MNLRDLHYLVAVADLGSFSKASEQCCVSQPTLSAQIKKLEDYLGVKVFERTNKTVMLTDIGEQIIGVARRVLQETETIKEMAKHAHDPLSGRFRLGAFPTLAPYYLPQAVAVIRKVFPKLELILIEEKTDTLISALKEGKLDAALLALPVNEEKFDTMPLFDDPFLLAVAEGHPLAGRKTISYTELAPYTLLLLEDGHCLRHQALDVCYLSGMKEQQEFRATSLETLREMVRAGTGITLIPQTARRSPDKGIVYIPFENPVPKRVIGLVWRKSSARVPVIEKMAGCLK